MSYPLNAIPNPGSASSPQPAGVFGELPAPSRVQSRFGARQVSTQSRVFGPLEPLPPIDHAGP